MNSYQVDEMVAIATEALNKGEKVIYIKLIRNLTGLGLRECKEIVDKLQRKNVDAIVKETVEVVENAVTKLNALSYGDRDYGKGYLQDELADIVTNIHKGE